MWRHRSPWSQVGDCLLSTGAGRLASSPRGDRVQQGGAEVDPVTPVASEEEIVGALPESIAQLEVIDGGGHITWMDVPDRFWPIIIEFIDSTIERERVEM